LSTARSTKFEPAATALQKKSVAFRPKELPAGTA
jgi:hypothetical protein